MTFFVSFWDAISSLNKRDQLPVFRAVVSYGLYGAHNEELTPTQSAFFTLMQPVLDASRKKAASGKQGGSKQKAESKQAGRENEKEDEKEKENENENECKEKMFEAFWDCYPRKDGKKDAFDCFCEIEDLPDVSILIGAIEKQKKSEGWKKNGGAFIPMPKNWLKGRHWEDEGVFITNERQLDADELAAIERVMGEKLQ